MIAKRWLTLILALFVLLGLTYALVTPVFEASDELWHYPMIRHLADGNALPVQVFDPAQAGPWRQEASQPPLYYYLGAALTFWIDTSDMEQVRLENPHVDNGVITADGNRNLTMHNPAWDPWQGTLLAVRIVRLASVLLGALTVYLTYAIAREAAPTRPEIALGAAAVNAFMPMFIFISGAVNNDNLAIMLSSLAVLLLIRLVTRPASGRFLPRLLLIGSVIGAAVLTKEGTLALVPLALGAIFVALWHAAAPAEAEPGLFWGELLRLLGRTLLYFVLLMLPVLAIAGWWYYRNIVLYGDWLGWNAFIAVLGERATPASLAQLWGERRGFMMAYWGLFGGVNVPMAGWVYSVLNRVLIAAVLGFVVYLVGEVREWLRAVGSWSWRMPVLIANLLDFVVARFALVVSLVFSAAVVYGLIQWATTTWSSQGRLVFTAVSTLTVLFVLGLVGWLPQRPSRWVLGALATFMFGVSALAPFVWIQPAYDVAAYEPPRPFVLQPVDVTYDDRLRLRGTAVQTEANDALAVQPGDEVWVHLEWDVLAPLENDWSVFVHLNDPVLGQPIAQRDMYLGQGQLLTSWLAPGTRVVNSYRLQVPETAVAPANLELAVGLYDFDTFTRLPLASGQDAVLVATLPLQAAPGAVPNATRVNFEDELELVGFEVAPRRVQPGETIELTLYWRAQLPLISDYSFFAQVVDADTTRWASHDVAPPEGTSSWEAGTVQAISFTLPVAPETPASTYPLIIGVYTQTPEGGFDRLQILTDDGRLTDDFLRLTPVRVD